MNIELQEAIKAGNVDAVKVILEKANHVPFINCATVKVADQHSVFCHYYNFSEAMFMLTDFSEHGWTDAELLERSSSEDIADEEIEDRAIYPLQQFFDFKGFSVEEVEQQYGNLRAWIKRANQLKRNQA